MLKEEIVQKKFLLLYVPHNSDSQLCFAISNTRLIGPGFLSDQIVQLARELQQLAGLNDQTPVDFGHIQKFEKVTYQKLYCFTETSNCPLS